VFNTMLSSDETTGRSLYRKRKEISNSKIPDVDGNSLKMGM
jgi:hypothetical protein